MPRTRKYSRKMKVTKSAKRTSGTSRRRLQSKNTMNAATRRAVNFVTGAVPVARTAYNLYNIARSGRSSQKKRYSTGVGKQGTGGYNQWTQRYEQATLGKLTARKINSMSLDRVILTHQNIGPFNDAGRLYLSNYDDGVGTKSYPLVLFELNSTNNYINGTLTYATPVHQLAQLTASGRMTTGAKTGQGADGVANQLGWVFEKGSHTQLTSQSYPMENAIHAWTSLDLECWGCTQKPTKYNIMLCQFSEDVLFPDLQLNNIVYYDSIPTTNNNASEFWQSLVKHYSYSPLAKLDDGYNKKKIKILKQYTFNIDPTANYENDPDPHVKTMKLFYRFNRKCNFQWKFANAAPQTTAEMNDADWQQEDGENQCRVHPNARMFVMVRASNFTPLVAPAAPSNTTSPSISWRMRTCYMINQ